MMKNNRLKQANLIDDAQDTLREYDSCLVSSERNNVREVKKKRVKFTDKIIFIDVECWKKYNAEQTADENFEGFNEEEENNEKENKKNDNNNNKRNKKDNVFCTCNIV